MGRVSVEARAGRGSVRVSLPCISHSVSLEQISHREAELTGSRPDTHLPPSSNIPPPPQRQPRSCFWRQEEARQTQLDPTSPSATGGTLRRPPRRLQVRPPMSCSGRRRDSASRLPQTFRDPIWLEDIHLSLLWQQKGQSTKDMSGRLRSWLPFWPRASLVNPVLWTFFRQPNPFTTADACDMVGLVARGRDGAVYPAPTSPFLSAEKPRLDCCSVVDSHWPAHTLLPLTHSRLGLLHKVISTSLLSQSLPLAPTPGPATEMK